MSLSVKVKEYLTVALANAKVAKELADEIDSKKSSYLVSAEVTEIADPSTATAEDCANKINELIQSLKDAGLMA